MTLLNILDTGSHYQRMVNELRDCTRILSKLSLAPQNQRLKTRQIMSLVNMADTSDNFEEIPIMYICLKLSTSDWSKYFLQCQLEHLSVSYANFDLIET